jgi:hypothetical protein
MTVPQINNINTFYDKSAWTHWNSHTMLHCKHQQSCNNKSPIMVNHNISMFSAPYLGNVPTLGFSPTLALRIDSLSKSNIYLDLLPSMEDVHPRVSHV